MKYAIIDPVPGEPPVAMEVADDAQLIDAWAFFATEAQINLPDVVVAEDGLSLRAGTVAEALNEPRKDKLAELEQLYDAIRYDAFLHEFNPGDSAWIPCNRDQRLHIIGIAQAITAGFNEGPFMIGVADGGFRLFTVPSQYIDLAVAMAKFTVDAQMALIWHEDAINGDADPASHSLNTTHWPNTRIELPE